nr:transporter substrate-binding domain-containing protein [Pantoea sp. B9002]
MLSGESVRWIIDNKTIKLAIWGNPHPPIYMGYDSKTYEGIGADYANILAKTLNKRVEVYHFTTLTEAKKGLDQGDVDALAFYTPTDLKADNYLTTQPYLLDYQVVVHKNNLDSQSLLNFKKSELAFVGDDETQRSLRSYFPEARLKPYLYFSEAMASLAYKATDAFWLNASTARFLIKQGVETQAKVMLQTLPATANVSFAVRSENRGLFQAIESTLTALPLADRIRIINNWGLDASFVVKKNPMMLNPDELAWIHQHPNVPVILPRAMHPLSFVDERGFTNGYAHSLLTLIAERTGIKFSHVTPAPGLHEGSLPEKQAQGVIASVIRQPQPEVGMRYSRSFAISPWVLVVDGRGGEFTSLAQMAGKTVTLTHDSGLYSSLKAHYPRVNFELTHNLTDAMLKVVRKQADAAISPQISADYLINKQFYNKLVITNALGIAPANFVMAVSSENPILLNILNKAMLDLSPKTMQQDLSPWQNYQAPPKVTVWDKYSRDLVKVAGLVILLLMFFFVRNRYLGRRLAERRRYEQQLEDQLRFIRTLIDDSPVALYVRDLRWKMLQCNNTYLQFFNTKLETVKDKSLAESGIISAASTKAFQRLYQKTLQSKAPLFTQLSMTTNDGKVSQVYHWSLPYRDHRGEINGIIGGFIDITEREQLLTELKQAKKVAEKAAVSKTIFLAQMSHEIRTPLNALIGLLELEHRQKSAPAKRAHNIAVAWQASQSLLALVGNILDMAKIESGTHNIKTKPISLRDAIQSQLTLFNHLAMQKQLTLSYHCDTTDNDILSDQTMFNQIVANLLSNAIKFTERGKVEVCLQQRDSRRQGLKHYILRVTDTGPGLTEYQQQAIFEPFVQVEDGRTNAEGTGLGLSICRQLANKLNGELTVESQPGVGASFIFDFYAESHCPENISDASVDPETNQRALNILVVDDNAPNRLVLCQQLEYIGHNAVAVEDAHQALIRWNLAKPPFDMVISDCNMPGMDGFELIKQLRNKEQEKKLPRRPMYGLTAMAEHEVVERGKAAGMTACLIKPLSLEALKAHLAVENLTDNAIPAKEGDVKTFFFSRMPNLSSSAIRDLSETLLVSNDQDIKQLQAAISSKNPQQTKDCAHRLLGTARMIKAEKLGHLCSDIERFSASEQWDIIESLLVSCIDEVRDIAFNLEREYEC